MGNDFYLLIGVDCEATQHSIGNPQLGARAVDGLLEIMATEDLLGTFFVIPTDLEASPKLYKAAAESGHEVGLHIHPADQGYEEFLGVYGPEEQRKIISEAADRFGQVMGHAPKSLCPGYFSANDYTFGVLVDLGFSHGRISLPTRMLPECASVWAGAPLDIHYAHRHNRLLPGRLDFVEIPHTIDPESRMWGGKNPQDLRVELVDAKNHWYTINKAVERQLAEDVTVTYISILTHNVFDYGDTGDFRRETLQKMIKHTRDIVSSAGGKILKATHEDVAKVYRQRVPIGRASGPRLELDTRGRS